MDDPSLLPFRTNNGHGHHYELEMDDEIEHEEDEIEEDEDDIQEQAYPEDEIDDDELEDHDDDDDEREIFLPPPQPPPERGGRRKGTPRRLQLSPPINSIQQQQQSSTSLAIPQQRLLPFPTSKSCSDVQSFIPTSDRDIDDEENDEDEQELNNENGYLHSQPINGIEYDFLDEDEYDENNNMNYNDEENIFEIVDDILADIVTIIVRDVRQQRQKNFKRRIHPPIQTNGHSKSKVSLINSKDLIPSNSINSSSKSTDPSILFHEMNKIIPLNSQSQSSKHKQSSSSSTTFSPPSSATKRQKTSDLSTIPSLSHQQLLWQMTQQLMMSSQTNETDSSSLLKQQLLGLNPPGPTIPKRVGRPPKQQIQPPQVMRSSTNMIPPISHSSSNASSFERTTNFAPRRRGRPPKYVTERGTIPGLPSHDLDPSSYDQLFAAIENSVTGNSSRTSSSAAFQSALASMLGHQSNLSLPIPPPVNRNGAPASMVKQSAGQTRHSLPGSKLSHGLEMPLMATKKRGPGRPPKSQMLIDSHQVLQATKRINSSSSNNQSVNNHFPPTMVPSSPSSFNLNAAFVEMLQQQHSR